jgi:hypothetical protein
LHILLCILQFFLALLLPIMPDAERALGKYR